MDNQCYEIVSHGIDDKCPDLLMRCLTKVGEEPFILKLAQNKRTVIKAKKILSTVRRVLEAGNEWAWNSETYKLIQGTGVDDIVVIETRVKGSVIRVATYLCDDKTPIFLFEFESHSGADSGISRQTKEKAVKLARIARNIVNND